MVKNKTRDMEPEFYRFLKFVNVLAGIVVLTIFIFVILPSLLQKIPSIFQEEFVIWKEECKNSSIWNTIKTIPYPPNDFYLSEKELEVCSTSSCRVYCLGECTLQVISKNTNLICEKVEADELSYLKLAESVISVTTCDGPKCLPQGIIRCSPDIAVEITISKTEITRQFLDENAECQQVTGIKIKSDAVRGKCSQWKVGNYTIGVVE